MYTHTHTHVYIYTNIYKYILYNDRSKCMLRCVWVYTLDTLCAQALRLAEASTIAQ